MPGSRGRSEAREQLMPKEGSDVISSSSLSHQFPQYDLRLPGTIPSSQPDSGPAAAACISNDDDTSYREIAVGPDSTAPVPGHGTHLRATTLPGADAAPVPSAAALPAQSPRPGQTDARPSGGAPSTGGSSIVAAMEIQEALLPPQPPPAFQHPMPLSQRRWMVAMFCLVAALLFADQNLLAPNLTAAAEYFGMDERQKDVLLGGVLMAAFFAVGAPAALVVGWLTDRGDINRRTLLFWVVVVGETPCLLTYWVTAYWQFFLLRALTGVAVGGCFPLVFSLLGDLFPAKRRAAVSAVVQIATGIGIAVGQALSGSIGPATNWRVPFVVVAAPSLAVALVMLLTTQEPPRGAFEEALRERFAEGLGPYEERISWAKVGALLRCPSNALVIGQGLPGSLPWGMVLTYFNDFLSQQKGFTVQAATLVLLMFGGGGALGVIGGGAGGQWLYNRRKEYQALLAGGCVLAGIGPLYALINADLQKVGLGPTCIVAALGGAVASVAGPNLRAVMLNVNEPETRGVALALQSMTDDLGKGLGPALVAGLIRAMGREGAFNIATACWVPCGIMLASLACFMRRDEAAMQARLVKASEDRAVAAAAAAGDGRGGGVTVPMPPASPRNSDGGGVSTPAVSAAGISPQQLTPYDVRQEERRLAKVRLLAEAGSSDSLVAGGPDDGTAGAGASWRLGRSNGVDMVRPPGAGPRAVAGEAGRAGGAGGGGSMHAEGEPSLPVSSGAAEGEAGPRPGASWGWPAEATSTFTANGAARPEPLYPGPFGGSGRQAHETAGWGGVGELPGVVSAETAAASVAPASSSDGAGGSYHAGEPYPEVGVSNAPGEGTPAVAPRGTCSVPNGDPGANQYHHSHLQGNGLHQLPEWSQTGDAVACSSAVSVLEEGQGKAGGHAANGSRPADRQLAPAVAVITPPQQQLPPADLDGTGTLSRPGAHQDLT